MNIFKKKTIIQSSEGLLDMLLLPNNTREAYSRPLTYYEKVVYVNRAIEKRGEKVGNIHFILRNKREEEITDHEILDLLAKPNNLQTGEQFFKLWQEYKDLYGEVFVLILKGAESKRKIELRLLNPKDCKPCYNNYGEFTGIDHLGQSNKYNAEEIIYDNRPNPADQFRGVSLLKSGATLIETSLEFEKQNYRTVQSGGKIEGIVSFDVDTLTEEQAKEFKENYRKQLEELPQNSGAIFMGGNAKYQDIAKSMKELGYLESKKMTLQDICILCDVPKVVINAFDDIKFDNADASIRVFLRETISPLMRQITTKLNEKLEIVGEEFELDFIEPTINDLDAQIKLNDCLGRWKLATINEMRVNLDMGEIEGGDEMAGGSSLEDFFPVNEEEDEENTDEDEKKTVKKKEFIHPLKNKQFRAEYYWKRIDKENKYENLFIKQFKTYLLDQRKRLIKNLGGKKKITKKALTEIFDTNTEVAIGKLMLVPILRKMMEEAGVDAKNLVESKFPFIWTNELDIALNKRAEFFLKEINRTTFKQLSEQFTESLELGEPRQDLIKRIDGYFEETYKNRTKTIARTEVHNAVQDSTLEGYQQAGMKIKIWVAVKDDRTRDEHWEMDGEERPINMPFSNGEMYPNEINCRCTI